MGDGKSSASLWPPPKRRKVSAVRDFPKGLKRIPKSTSDVACGARDENLKASGSENVNENKQYSEKFDPKPKGDVSCGLKNVKEFKRSSEELGLKVKGDEAFGSNNAKKFKGSSKKLDSKLKEDEAFGSKNVQELKRCSEKLDQKVKEDDAFSQTGNMQHTFPKRRKVSAIRTFPPGLVRVMPLKSIHTNTSMADGTNNNLSAKANDLKEVGEHIETDDANMVESKYGISNGEGPDRSGHNSPAINDVQEPTYQLDDGPDERFLQVPNVAEFFSDDCHNGFLFEDDDEPSEAIADSKADKLSILEELKEDVCSLLIPQKNPACKNTKGSSPQRFSSVGGSVSKDSPTRRAIYQIEEGGNRVGIVEYMPEKETPTSFSKSKTSPSGKVYKKAPMNCASEQIARRDVVQGLMAAKGCPWEHIVKRKPTL